MEDTIDIVINDHSDISKMSLFPKTIHDLKVLESLYHKESDITHHSLSRCVHWAARIAATITHAYYLKG